MCRREARAHAADDASRWRWEAEARGCLSRLVLLQVMEGDVGSARGALDLSRAVLETDPLPRARVLEGCVLAAEGEFASAKRVLEAVMKETAWEEIAARGAQGGAEGKAEDDAGGESRPRKSSVGRRNGWCRVVLEGDALELATAAACNGATCLLNCGQLEEALNLLQDFLRADPERRLRRDVISNLAALYDLALDAGRAKERKRVLRHLAEKFRVPFPGPVFRLHE